METKQFEVLVNEVLSNSKIQKQITIKRLIDQTAKKYYDKSYEPCELLEVGTIYGVIIDGIVYFDFKVGSIDSLFKSFLRRFCSSVKEVNFNSELFEYFTKDELLDKIITSNKDRVLKGCFYTTLYGIGFWSIFSSRDDKEIAKQLHVYLKDNNIKYSNELSEAGWVYRFVIKQGVEIHNALLNNFTV